jgi:hypothetical protein
MIKQSRSQNFDCCRLKAANKEKWDFKSNYLLFNYFIEAHENKR